MSGRKNVIASKLLVQAQSLGASFNSQAINIQYLDRVSIAINCTATAGSANGTWNIQGRVSPSARSLDYPLAPGPSTEWANLDISTMSLAGSDTNFVIDIINTGLVEIRIAYTRSSGTGSCDIWVAAKEV